MAFIKCDMCGGQLKSNGDGTHTCLSCGTIQNSIDDPEYTAKKETYLKACNLASQGTISSLTQAIFLFSQVKGFREADSKKSVCEKTLDELQIAAKRNEKERARRETKERIKSSVKKFLVTLIVLAVVIGVFIVRPLKKKWDHDIDDIIIKLTEMSSLYDPEAKYSYNGCYYVYFDFEIKNETNADIDYIQVVTYFETKNGKSIGQLQSEFGGMYSSAMNLKKNKTMIKESYLSETNPEKDDLLYLLYGTNVEDWTISYKITSVKFSDGYNN